MILQEETVLDKRFSDSAILLQLVQILRQWRQKMRAFSVFFQVEQTPGEAQGVLRVVRLLIEHLREWHTALEVSLHDRVRHLNLRAGGSVLYATQCDEKFSEPIKLKEKVSTEIQPALTILQINSGDWPGNSSC